MGAMKNTPRKRGGGSKAKRASKPKAQRASKRAGAKSSKEPNGSTARARTARAPASLPPRTGKEIDPTKLDQTKAVKRLASIYDLEREVEVRKHVYENAKRDLRSARADFESAVEALEKEIREQRFGPGPLFNAEGTGPADYVPKTGTVNTPGAALEPVADAKADAKAAAAADDDGGDWPDEEDEEDE